MPEVTFADTFATLERDGELSPETVRNVFDAILAGQWTPVQVAGLMIALRLAGETATTIAAAASSLREAMVRVDHGLERVLDTAGTGGDGHGSVNLSTGAALLAAAAGIPVAKHGNRAISSRAGSADVLEALGIRLDLAPAAAADVLKSVGITFMMAPHHHPAMRHSAVARRELGVRSLFNCLGPLANPAGATHQLLGAYDAKLLPILAGTLKQLGTRRAWVVRGVDGLDEMSPCGPTQVVELSEDGTLRDFTLSPEDFGLSTLSRESIAGGDAAHNARIIEQVLSGEAHPSRDAFVLNAAAALVVADNLAPRDASAKVRQLLDESAGIRLLERWRQRLSEIPTG